MLKTTDMKIFLALCVTTLFSFTVKSEQNWWDSMSLYQVYPRSFMDSDGDGVGDLKGVISRLDHLVESKVNAFWMSPINTSPMVDSGYDASDFIGIDPLFGTMQDFENLVKRAHDLSLKIIVDFVPNHSSDQHEWFKKSVAGIKPYTDYYVWHKGHNVDGTVQRPNNWRSEFNGSAWTWNDQRQAFYLHQFTSAQADLNYRNKDLIEEMKNILRFWMKKGVDGFRIDATRFLFEDEKFLDEPLTGSLDGKGFPRTVTAYTRDQAQNYEMIQEWRDVVDDYVENVDQVSRVLMVEAYANISVTMKYYTSGCHFPFNFGLMEIKNSSTATDVKNIVEKWMLNMPDGGTANWVVSNHDNPRLVSRLGIHRAGAVTALVLLLPGVAVTYYGDELGMPDAPVVSKDPARFRDPERSPMQWDSSTSAGFSTNVKTWLPVNPNYKTFNVESEKASVDSYYSYYKALASLRDMPALKTGKLNVKVLENDVLAFSRYQKKKKSVFVVINFGDQKKTVSLMGFENCGTKLEFSRSTPGLGLTSGSLMNADKIKIPPNAVLVFFDA